MGRCHLVSFLRTKIKRPHRVTLLTPTMAFLSRLPRMTVEPVLFLYMFCFFMSFPLIQQLAFKKICLEKYDTETCKNLTKADEDFVQGHTSQWILHQSIALAVPSIFASLIYGSWSDKAGRKLILVLPSIGGALLYVSHILNSVFMSLDVNLILIGVFISGLFGGFATTLLGVFSYISDITDKVQRTSRIAVLESMTFLGATAGNLLGGVLVDHGSFMAAFGVCLAVNLITILYIWFLLPESYFPEDDREVKCSLIVVHVYNHLKKSLQVLTKQRPRHQRRNVLVVIFGAMSFVLIIFAGYNDITPLYSKHSPRNFSPSLIGYLMAEVSFIRGLGTVLVIPLLAKLFKWSDFVIATAGASVTIGFYIFLALSSKKWMMFVAGLLAIGSAMPVPCLRSFLSKQVESSELGSLFAVVASLEVVETLLGSLIFNSIYTATVSRQPGFCYFLISGMLLLPISSMIWLYVSQRRENQQAEMGTSEGPLIQEDYLNSDNTINEPSYKAQYGSQAPSNA